MHYISLQLVSIKAHGGLWVVKDMDVLKEMSRILKPKEEEII